MNFNYDQDPEIVGKDFGPKADRIWTIARWTSDRVYGRFGKRKMNYPNWVRFRKGAAKIKPVVKSQGLNPDVVTQTSSITLPEATPITFFDAVIKAITQPGPKPGPPPAPQPAPQPAGKSDYDIWVESQRQRQSDAAGQQSEDTDPEELSDEQPGAYGLIWSISKVNEALQAGKTTEDEVTDAAQGTVSEAEAKKVHRTVHGGGLGAAGIIGLLTVAVGGYLIATGT